MKSIGIIANPASGKDIRRLVSHATTIDNNEKVNIVERVILGAQQCGVTKVYIMPDTFRTGYKVIDKLETSKELKADVEVLDMRIHASMEDTVKAAGILEEKSVGCMIVLGGDGTNRAVAKSIVNTPLISISTGTNNVYPQMLEGTTAGIAAGVVASKKYSGQEICGKDKRIEIYKNNEFVDIALIDAVISKNLVSGAKAIWDMEDMVKVFVSRCHPCSIGFSSILGMKTIVKKEDDFGVFAEVNNECCEILAPLAAGLMLPVKIDSPEKLYLNQEHNHKAVFNGMIAVDGEREIRFTEKDNLMFKITRNGPYAVDIVRTLETAQRNGFFERPGL